MTRSQWRRVAIALIGLMHLPVIHACAQDEGGTATIPIPREEAYWQGLHKEDVDRAKQGGVDLLFLGDSITQGWMENDTWNRYYGSRNAANFGIGGDCTQHVLWRLQNGAIDGISPKAVVLMIGTNNIGQNSAQEIAAGIKRIVTLLRAKLPETKILLLGIFPRGKTRIKDIPRDTLDPRPAEVNTLIQPLHDGKNVFYLDISKSFLDEHDEVPKYLMPDFLHLSPAGYEVWADAIEPSLWKLLDGDKTIKKP